VSTTENERREETMVQDWRYEVLYENGWPMADAKLIARRGDIDLHYALDVLRRCADPDLARRIVL
jgi:hypothetical protein